MLEANIRTLKSGATITGDHYRDVSRASYEVPPAARNQGGACYRNITGKQRDPPLGFVACLRVKSGTVRCSWASYPITTRERRAARNSLATRIFPVYTFPGRGRDSRRVARRLGASFGGAIAITTTSGPGMNLKAEARRTRGEGRVCR